MERIFSVAAAVVVAVPFYSAMGQGISDKPMSAVPPAGRSDHSARTNTTAQSPAGGGSAASKEGYAHNTGDVANGPTPPGQSATQAGTTSASGAASSTIKPGPAYANGTGDVGNSTENNGVLGSQGAGASTTMQSGHASNR